MNYCLQNFLYTNPGLCRDVQNLCWVNTECCHKLGRDTLCIGSGKIDLLRNSITVAYRCVWASCLVEDWDNLQSIRLGSMEDRNCLRLYTLFNCNMLENTVYMSMLTCRVHEQQRTLAGSLRSRNCIMT
jgi:hypothetical protein